MTPVETIEFLDSLLIKAHELNNISISLNTETLRTIRSKIVELNQNITTLMGRIETLTESKNILVHELDKAKNS